MIKKEKKKELFSGYGETTNGIRKLKILYIGAVLRKEWRGGEPVVARNTIKLLEDLGYDVKQSNFELKYWKILNRIVGIYRQFFGILDTNFFATRFYIRMIKKGSPDIIIAQYDYDTSIIKASEKTNKKIIVYSHIWWPICPKLTLLKWTNQRCNGFLDNDCTTCIVQTNIHEVNRYLVSIFKLFIRERTIKNKMKKRICYLNSKNAVVVVPSSQMKDYFILNGVNTKQVRIIPNGITPSDFVCNITERENIITYLGGFSEAKGYSIFLEVARKVNILHPNVKFYATGSYKEDKKVNYINYTGYIDSLSVKALLIKSKCTLFPAIWDEPFSLVWLESMACGTPVVTFNTGSSNEVINDGKNGILVEAFDIDKMVSRLIQLLTDNQLFLNMSDSAKKTVNDFFNEKRRINMLNNLILEHLSV